MIENQKKNKIIKTFELMVLFLDFYAQYVRQYCKFMKILQIYNNIICGNISIILNTRMHYGTNHRIPTMIDTNKFLFLLIIHHTTTTDDTFLNT